MKMEEALMLPTASASTRERCRCRTVLTLRVVLSTNCGGMVS